MEVGDSVGKLTLAAIIEFFYSTVIDDYLWWCFEIAARLLEVEEVEQFCFKFLESMLDNQTCVFVAKASEEFDEAALHGKAIDYMITNLFGVAQTPDLHQLSPKVVSGYFTDCKEAMLKKIA